MPVTTSPDASTCAPVWRDSSFKAAASGWAGTLMLKVGSVACADDCAEARLLQLRSVQRLRYIARFAKLLPVRLCRAHTPHAAVTKSTSVPPGVVRCAP